MNGVRRFLAVGSAGSNSPPSAPSDIPSPLVATSKPSWPPQPPSPVQSHPDSPISSTKSPIQPLFLRKDKPKPSPANNDEIGNPSSQSGRSTNGNSFTTFTRGQSSSPSSHPVGSTSPAAESPSSPPAHSNRFPPRRSANLQDSNWKQTPGLLNTRDELLISLLASEAVVDSREFEILTAEEVEDLKKVGLRSTPHLYK
jgi:hypothetical protein